MRRALALLALILLPLALAAGEARAHPYGQKPVLFVARAEGGLSVRWVANQSEFDAIAAHLGLGPVDARAMGERGEFRAYFLDRIRIRAGGAACRGAVEHVVPVRDGAVVEAAYACAGPADEITVQATILQDIDPAYQTLLYARTDADPVRGIFTSGVTAIEVDLVRAASVARAEREDQEAGRADRIIAMLQGIDGSVSVGVALGLAFVLGLLHGLTPGHGKTIAAAYLIGSGGTGGQAVALAGIVTATHALATALIAAIPIALGHAQPPGSLSSALELGAGLLILAMGVWLLRRPVRLHDPDRSHPGARGLLPARRLAGIGFVGGLVPNPEALLVVLVAFSLHQWTAGAALIGAFSAGLGLVVLAIAIAAVRGGPLVVRLAGGKLAAMAPRLAAGVFLLMGLVVTSRGIAGI